MSSPQSNTVKVAEVMSKKVKTVGRNDKLAVADKLMAGKRIRHVPVLDDDGLVAGMLSQRDIFRGALLRSLGYGERAAQLMLDQVLVKEAMTEEVISITPEATIAEAAKLMAEERVGCLPVIEGNKLKGIITEMDLLRLVAG